MEFVKLYAVYGRYGTSMMAPVFFQSEEKAKKYIQHKIADCIRENFYETMEEDEKISDFDMERYDEDDYVLSWASLKDHCACYNINGTYDTACTGDEWTEYDIAEVNLPEDLEDANEEVQA